ncbi:hypothetical protein EIP86_004012 [Pleurotus ostreatoroseus]|nr:hypothetical protein EIP86_004012 [Pleurotus ostreatoroseus]
MTPEGKLKTTEYPFEKVWAVMEKVYESGRVKAIGYKTVREDPLIVELATKYKVKPTQVILAWHISRGVGVVPGSKNPDHQKENIDLPTLSPEDLKRISGLDKGQRLCNKPDERGEVYGWPVERLGW